MISACYCSAVTGGGINEELSTVVFTALILGIDYHQRQLFEEFALCTSVWLYRIIYGSVISVMFLALSIRLVDDRGGSEVAVA